MDNSDKDCCYNKKDNLVLPTDNPEVIKELKRQIISKIDYLLTLNTVPDEFKQVFKGQEYSDIKAINC